ncbi:hypothetical protein BE20_11895 [Sorangium cellulosum]|uniref:Uncharacterized protein n=1 Tax=Sorangium cellulosum TaxID=56 RepID=A0A150RB72_SORCE|nr:hypothetical protein BE18_15765 [Sorangium cellulosum]KYF92381.1 hypothetical protein BE20_11895 [Sorangium cellulosum]
MNLVEEITQGDTNRGRKECFDEDLTRQQSLFLRRKRVYIGTRRHQLVCEASVLEIEIDLCEL